ncbi:MAG: hypothetical protein K6C99_06490 [Lachnospiraceae bacterium]|nr:hypothetical protein [Lachnospiraceae bacterium]
MLDVTASPADVEKQMTVAEAIVDQMKEGDELVVNYYTSSLLGDGFHYFGNAPDKNMKNYCHILR